MAAEQIKEFLFKITPFMMLILIANIFDDTLLHRTADAERRIPVLPPEPLAVREGLPNPPCRIGLERVDQFGDGDSRRHGDIEVGMIRSAFGLDEPGTLEARDGTHEGMKTMVPLRIQEASPSFGAPNHRKVYAKIFPGHTPSNWIMGEMAEGISVKSAAPLALDFHEPDYPGLTAGPTHCRPFGPPGRMYKLQGPG